MKLSLIFDNIDLFIEGLLLTVELTVLSLLIGFCIALPFGIIRAREVPYWSRIVNLYVYAIRGTPLLVQLYVIYYGLSQFVWVRESFAWPILREAYWCALIAFSLNSGAYATEIIRGAIQSVPRGQIEAAKALGLSAFQIDRLVLIPSALRKALPQYGNEVVFMLHGSALASVITLTDLLGAGRELNSKYYITYEGFITAAVFYMILTGIIVLFFRALELRYLSYLTLR